MLEKGRSLVVEMENGITGKCEEVCLVVRIGSLGAKKDKRKREIALLYSESLG